jgi:hypothetical protein
MPATNGIRIITTNGSKSFHTLKFKSSMPVVPTFIIGSTVKIIRTMGKTVKAVIVLPISIISFELNFLILSSELTFVRARASSLYDERIRFKYPYSKAVRH